MADSIGYQPATRTAQNVISHVQNTFGDLDGIQLTVPVIISWINDAQEQIVNRTRPLKTRSTVTAVAGQSEYQLPGNTIIQIEAILWDGQLLENVPYARALSDFVGSGQTGKPEVWWEWNGRFTFFPIPQLAKVITVLYSTLATPVATGADLLGVPDKYYQTLLSYVMKQAYELDENMAASQTKGQEFNQDLADFTDEERTAQHLTYETMTYVDQGW